MRSKTLIFAFSSLFLTATMLQANPPLPFNTMQAHFPETYYHFHAACVINFPEAKIDLEDGSQWKISDDDRTALLAWRTFDHVVITPNRGFNNDCSYYLTNQVNGSYVRGNLIRGPAVGGERTMQITGLDANSRYKRAIYLNNGTSWRVDDSDLFIIDNWHIGDPIIIGRNDAWFTSSGTFLINVTTNTYVRVRKI